MSQGRDSKRTETTEESSSSQETSKEESKSKLGVSPVKQTHPKADLLNPKPWKPKKDEASRIQDLADRTTLEFLTPPESPTGQHIAKIAVALVENCISNPNIIPFYACLQRDDFDTETTPTEQEITAATRYLKNVQFEFQHLKETVDGETDNEKNVQSITLNDRFVAVVGDEEEVRACFGLWITMIHELSHFKVRHNREIPRGWIISPEKFKIPGKTADFGFWVELQIFGGIVDKDDWSFSAPLSYTTHTNQATAVLDVDDKKTYELIEKVLFDCDLPLDQFKDLSRHNRARAVQNPGAKVQETLYERNGKEKRI